MLRLLIYWLAMAVLLYLTFLMVDIKRGIGSEKTGENLLIAVIVGLLTSAALVFLPKLFRNHKG